MTPGVLFTKCSLGIAQKLVKCFLLLNRIRVSNFKLFFLLMGLIREKRKVERFDLQVETIVNVHNDAKVDIHPMLLSRDISCAGVFLDTKNPLPIGTEVDLDLLLSQHELGNQSKDERINISTSGKVVRTNEQGMAVEFDKLYKVSHFRLQPEQF